MSWCNLYSTASKYNICIKQSRYRNFLRLSGGIFFSLLLISYATYAYQFVLVIAVLTMTLLSIWIAKKRQGQLIRLQFTLDENCVCLFNDAPESTVESTFDKKEQFQLLASSRYSFFGCWLHMTALSNMYSPEPLPNKILKSSKKKLLFIYRDSLSSEDFSRLTQAIRVLKTLS